MSADTHDDWWSETRICHAYFARIVRGIWFRPGNCYAEITFTSVPNECHRARIAERRWLCICVEKKKGTNTSDQGETSQLWLCLLRMFQTSSSPLQIVSLKPDHVPFALHVRTWVPVSVNPSEHVTVQDVPKGLSDLQEAGDIFPFFGGSRPWHRTAVRISPENSSYDPTNV